MNECSFIETTNAHSNLSYQTKFELNYINKIKDYFTQKLKKEK